MFLCVCVFRYYAIMHPLRARNVHTSKRAVLILSLFWILAFILLLPQVFIQRIEPLLLIQPDQPIRMANVCVEYFYKPIYNIFYTLFFYFVLYLGPVFIMSVTYGIIARKLWKRRRIGESCAGEDDRRLREKKKIVRMLVVIVILFTLSWLPFFTCHLIQLFVPLTGYWRRSYRVLAAVLQLLGYSNSCVNPIIYCFMNDKFQKSAVATVCCKCAARKMSKRRGSSHTFLGGQQTTHSLLTENKSMMDSPVHKTTFL